MYTCCVIERSGLLSRDISWRFLVQHICKSLAILENILSISARLVIFSSISYASVAGIFLNVLNCYVNQEMRRSVSIARDKRRMSAIHHHSIIYNTISFDVLPIWISWEIATFTDRYSLRRVRESYENAAQRELFLTKSPIVKKPIIDFVGRNRPDRPYGTIHLPLPAHAADQWRGASPSIGRSRRN